MSKPKRVLGDGAECCGEGCELCAEPKAEKSKAKPAASKDEE